MLVRVGTIVKVDVGIVVEVLAMVGVPPPDGSTSTNTAEIGPQLW